MLATEKDEKPDRKKIAILLNLLGNEGVEVFTTFTFEGDESSEKYTDVVAKFQEYCVPRRNIVFESYKFFSCSQQEGQSFDVYLTQLKTLAASCEFSTQEESLIRDRVVVGIRDKVLQERLLREQQLTLQKAAEYVRASEVSKEQLKVIHRHDDSLQCQIDALKLNQKPSSSESDSFKCRKCGRWHKQFECPAFNRLCNVCRKKGHFASQCQSLRLINRQFRNKYNAVHEFIDNNNETQSLYIDSLNINEMYDLCSENTWYKTVSVHGKPVNFKLDTGAQVYILPLKMYNNLKLSQYCKLIDTKLVLHAYGNNVLMPKGKAND
nr:uncharacterized protein LOC107441381 [Parasteatoda tepidariorum]